MAATKVSAVNALKKKGWTPHNAELIVAGTGYSKAVVDKVPKPYVVMNGGIPAVVSIALANSGVSAPKPKLTKGLKYPTEQQAATFAQYNKLFDNGAEQVYYWSATKGESVSHSSEELAHNIGFDLKALYGDDPDKLANIGAVYYCGKCDTDSCTCGRTSTSLETHEGSFYGTAQAAKWGFDATKPFSDQVRRFYGAYACYLVSGWQHKDKLDEIARPLADSIFAAAMISCAGESRYSSYSALHEVGLRARKKYLEGERWKTSPLGKLLIAQGSTPSGHDTRHHGANGLIASGLYAKNAPWAFKARAAHVLRTSFLFQVKATQESGGCGGLLWAFAADRCYQYARGKLTPVMFIDAVLDLVHNGGALLSKVWNTNIIQHLLDLKRFATPEQMALYAPNDVRAMFGLEECRPVSWAMLNQDGVVVKQRYLVAQNPGYDKLPKASTPADFADGPLWCEWLQTAEVNGGKVVTSLKNVGIRKFSLAVSVGNINDYTKSGAAFMTSVFNYFGAKYNLQTAPSFKKMAFKPRGCYGSGYTIESTEAYNVWAEKRQHAKIAFYAYVAPFTGSTTERNKAWRVWEAENPAPQKVFAKPLHSCSLCKGQDHLGSPGINKSHAELVLKD